jgi:uncharacterized protein YraI
MAAHNPLTTTEPFAATNAFTNQQLIDAFFDAANARHNGDYQGLLLRAGLDLHALATNRSGPYGGVPLGQLPNLDPADREEISASLLRQLARRATTGTVNTPDGANLRAGPGRDHAFLVALPVGTALTILSEIAVGEERWLLVRAGESVGYLFATLVTQGGTSDSTNSTSTSTTDHLPPDNLPTDNSLETVALEASTRLEPPADAPPHVVAAAQTWNSYGGLIEAESLRLQLDPAVAVAILGVESSGRAFERGRMVIRFENHIFLHYWGRANRELFDRHFTGSPHGSEHRWRRDPNGEWLPCHTGQEREWQLFDFARTLDERAALYAISMGAAQIMGFNHAAIGYGTPRAMFDAFQRDVRHQLAALFRFIEVNNLQEAVRRADFVAFARSYNGHGQEAVYAPRMQRFYDAFRQLREASRDAVGRLPQPGVPAPFHGDAELLAAWREYVASSFANHQTLFQGLLQNFLRPYWTTVWMYRALFGLGVISLLVAVVVAITTGQPASVLLFGGLSAIALLGFFFNRPTLALEQNLHFLTWLGILYNSYWTRLTLLDNAQSVQHDITTTTDEAIARIQELAAEHAKHSAMRPGLRLPFTGSLSEPSTGGQP